MSQISNPLRNRQLKQRRFVFLYTVTLLLAFSPFKAVGQVLPFFVLFGLIFYVQVRPNLHLQKYPVLIGLYGLIGVVYWLILPEFWWPGYLFFLVTFSSFLLLAYDFSAVVSGDLLQKLGTVTLVIITLEAFYGTLQFIGALGMIGLRPWTGDFVWGTLAPPLNPTYRGTSPTFVLLISTLLLFAVATSPPRLSAKRIGAFVVILVCWMTASLLHSVIYFSAAAVAATVVSFVGTQQRRRFTDNFVKRRRGVLLVLLALVVLVLIGAMIYGENYARILAVFAGAAQVSPDAPYLKMRVLYDTLFTIPDRFSIQPLLGLGPGQFSSRAALILTGEYLSRASIPFLDKHTSTFTQVYIMPYLANVSSSNHFPSSSWLTVYGETGIIGLGIVLLFILRTMRRFRMLRSNHFVRMNFSAMILLFYVLLLGLQTVYWEYTQAIFPSIFALKLLYDYLGRENVTQKIAILGPRSTYTARVRSEPVTQAPAGAS